MKLLKLTRHGGLGHGNKLFLRPDLILAMEWVAAGAPTCIDYGTGMEEAVRYQVTETPEAIAAMLAEPPELEREAWRQMEACSQAIRSAMSTVEHAAMAVRNAQ